MTEEVEQVNIFLCAEHGRYYKNKDIKECNCPICGYPMEWEATIP